MDIFNVASKPVSQTASQTTSTQSVTNKTSDVAPVQQKQMSTDQVNTKIDSTVKELNQHMDALNTNVTFGYNDKINSMFVDVMEKSTGKLIRKIPSEEAMHLSEKMKEIVGMIFDKKG
ncbi:FlaG family protein [Sulfurospirillum sp. 1612]|uniref:FlaG family protein n=1 Tax=Sulfurospirillum sp. 1612 TaxID=3094835 RepID=UPI002F94281C